MKHIDRKFPTNAQASWRWTMGLVDNITRDPSLLSIADLQRDKDWDSVSQAILVQDFMRLIGTAKFIFWDVEIFNAALRGSESFVGEHFDTTDWWVPTYYTYNEMQNSLYHKDQVSFGMLMLPIQHKDHDRIIVPIGFNGVINPDIKSDQGTDLVDSFALEMIGQAYEGEPITEDHLIGQQLSASAAFLKMKVAAKERTRLPRPERRRMKKEGKTEPELYTVSLRKSQGRAEYAGDGEPIERDCHWMVSGHWRRQWYPSVEKHAPLWIDGYVKGDTTKPFKLSKKRVFAAVR